MSCLQQAAAGAAAGQRDELLGEARKHFRAYHYGTTVGAALPVIETLKNLVRTGDHVNHHRGRVFSGTLGYLCDQLAQGKMLSQPCAAHASSATPSRIRATICRALMLPQGGHPARELGLQVESHRTSKLKPLSRKKYLKENDPDTSSWKSLTKLDAEVAQRVAASKVQVACHAILARITPGAAGAKVTVGPGDVDAAHPAAALRGAEGFRRFPYRALQGIPMVVRGAGAGGAVTAAGVLADILRLAQNIRGPAVSLCA